MCEREREGRGGCKIPGSHIWHQSAWSIKTEVIPVVTAALKNVASALESYLDKLPGNHRLTPLLKAAVLGSAHILRTNLDLPRPTFTNNR